MIRPSIARSFAAGPADKALNETQLDASGVTLRLLSYAIQNNFSNRR